MNWLDRAVAYVSPQAGIRRAQARLLFDAHRKNEARIRGFEAARMGRRTSGWNASGSSANSETEQALAIIRARSRDLVTNNVWAKRAVNVITANTIGEGIIAKIKGRTDRQVKLIDEIYEDWADTLACDADGRHDFYGLQALTCRGLVANGEMLIRRRWRRANDFLPVPMQLQVLEPDFLDTAKNEREASGFFTIQGIRFSPLGRRVGYWLFDEHPGGNVTGQYHRWNSRLVDARDIIHLYRMDRAGQVRGVPWGTSCIMRLKDFDDYEDAQLLRQKLAACFTVFVSAPDTSSLPGVGNDQEEEEARRIEPGMIEFLTGGKQISFASPPGVDGFKDVSVISQRAVATGFDVPYEFLSGDLSQINFSSLRAGFTEFGRHVKQWRSEMFLPHLCQGVFAWFRDAAELAGRDVSGIRAKHISPRREYVDPTKEVPAEIKSIRAGISCLSEVVEERGRDFRQHLEQYKQDIELIDEFGLTLEADARGAEAEIEIPQDEDEAPKAGKGGQDGNAAA